MADSYSQYYNDPNLTNLQGASNAAQTQADVYTSSASQLPYQLKQAVLEKLNYNKDLIEQQNKAMAQYFVAPSEARVKYQDIENPMNRENLVAQSRAQAYIPYANLTDLLGQRMGSINDIVGAGTAAYNTMATQAQSRATGARTAFEDALQKAKLLTDAMQTEQARKASSAGSGGLAGQQLNQARTSLQSDVQNMSNFDKLYQRYSSYLPEYEIRNAYNSGPMAQQWGPAKENIMDLQKSMILPTSKQIQDQLSTATEGQQKLDKIDNALSILENGQATTGMLQGRLMQAKTLTGGNTQQESDLMGVITQIRSGELFTVGGKALTKTELDQLKDNLPDIGYDTSENINRLKRLKKDLQEIFNKNISGGSNDSFSNSSSIGTGNVGISDYANQFNTP